MISEKGTDDEFGMQQKRASAISLGNKSFFRFEASQGSG